MRTLTLLCLIAPMAGTAVATDIQVGPSQSIQAAIDSAAPGDRVFVLPGTYAETIDFGGKDLQVIGLRGAAQTTLNGGGSGPVVRFSGGESSLARFAGFTVTGGAVGSFGAGGIQCLSGSTPSIEDCVIQGNSGKFGGGVSGNPFLRRTSIVNNTASLTHGGGVYGAPHMRYCVVAGNHATSADGGGLYLVNGDATLEDCVVIDNGAIFANSSGGGIYIKSNATAQIRRSVIAGNFATGGVFAGVGGGVRAESAGSVIENCTVVENSVSGSSTLGAGTYGPLVVNNSIVRGNLAGPDISSAASVSYSNVGSGHADTGNVDLFSGFVDAADRDWHLAEGSPLIDVGDPGLLDADGSRSDIGAFDYRLMYTRSNTLADHWTDTSWPEISTMLGGKQVLQIRGGAVSANETFWTLGSMSGTAPGFSVLGVIVPLNIDEYLIRVGRMPNSNILSNSLGTLDAFGSTQTVFRLGPNLGIAPGAELHHASILRTTDPSQPAVVTQPVLLRLVF